ncbi:MAG: hypothetical protein ACP5KX_07915, partial [Caldisericia bacterium]
MKRFFGKTGFALITVFITSLIIASIIGFTFISVSRQINLKSMFSTSKKTLSVADAGIEQMIRYVQSYHFLSPAEYLAANDTETPVLYSLKDESYFDSILDSNGYSSCKTEIKNLILQNYPQYSTFQDFLNLFKNYYTYNGSDYPSRAKYFYDYDYILGGLIYKNGQVVNETHSDYGNLQSIGVTQNVKSLIRLLRLPSYPSGCEQCLETIIDKITEDIQKAYEKWEKDLLGNDLIIDITKSGDDLGKIEKMIIELGGLTSSPDPSSCQGLNYSKVVVPYDIDYPAITNVQYEGIIIRSADWLKIGKDTNGDNTPDVYTRKLVISAISYVFDKPVPTSTFDSIKSLFTCSNGSLKREEDKEYKKYADNPNSYNVYLDHRVFINSLDVDKINDVLKNAGYSTKVTAVKRAIRGEFEVPYVYENVTPPIVDVLLGENNINITSVTLGYKDYLIATDDYINLPSGEILYGPIRSNNSIDFYGTTWDALMALKPNKITHKGKFKFTYNGKTYTVDLSGWNGAQTGYQAPVTPSLNGLNYVKVIKEGGVVFNDGTNNYYKSYYLDIDGNNAFTQNVDKIIVSYTNNSMPLTDNTIINTAKTNILNIVNGTQYYIDGGGKEVQLDFQTNGKIKVTIGGKNQGFIDMPNNYPQTINGVTVPGGVIYVNGELEVRGYVNGVVTVFATEDVHIRSDIRYVNDPVTDPNSSLPNLKNIDSFGIITLGKVIVDNNSPNALQINMNILADDGFQSDKNNPNKIKEFVGSMSFTDTYSAEYRWEWLHFDYDLKVLRPPLFPSVGETEPTYNIIPGTLPEKDLKGRINEIKFGRILWREMANP